MDARDARNLYDEGDSVAARKATKKLVALALDNSDWDDKHEFDRRLLDLLENFEQDDYFGTDGLSV